MTIMKAFALSTAFFMAAGLPSGTVYAAGNKQKTVVLVHGAFADGSSWSKVIPMLEAKGLKVVAVQNPLSSLANDVDATNRVIMPKLVQSFLLAIRGAAW